LGSEFSPRPTDTGIRSAKRRAALFSGASVMLVPLRTNEMAFTLCGE
jgi:hypothetical protein